MYHEEKSLQLYRFPDSYTATMACASVLFHRLDCLPRQRAPAVVPCRRASVLSDVARSRGGVGESLLSDYLSGFCDESTPLRATGSAVFSGLTPRPCYDRRAHPRPE